MSNTLEKLVAEGGADPEELTPQNDHAEPEIEPELEAEAVVAEPEGEVEIVLQDAGDASKALDKDKIDHAFTKLKRQKKAIKQEAEATKDALTSKNAEVEQLKAQMDELKRYAVKEPQYHDFDDEASYRQALLAYDRLVNTPAQAANAETIPAPAPVQADFTDSVNSHYERAEKLGVNLDKFATAEKNLRTQFGEQLTDALIHEVGEGSEKVVMYLGSNPAQITDLQNMLVADPTGNSAVKHLIRMATRLETSKSSISKAPRQRAHRLALLLRQQSLTYKSV